MQRLLRDAVRPYLGRVAMALLCMALVAGATGVSAWLMKPVVNNVFIGHRATKLWQIGLAVLLTFLVKGIATYGQAVLMSHVSQRIISDFQEKLFAHLIRMDLAFFQNTPTGSLVSRFTNDVNALRGAVSNALTGIGLQALTLIGLVAVMFIQDWQLAAISFFVFPLAVLPMRKLGRRMRKVTANTQVQLGEFTTVLDQTFQGVRHVKAYGMEAYEERRVERIVGSIFHLVQKAARVRSAASPIMETLGGLAITVIIVYGGAEVIAGRTTAGQFFSFITALLTAYQPLKSLAGLNLNIQEGLAAASRIFSVLDQQPRILDKPGATELAVQKGEVRFQNVTFSYLPGRRALMDLTLSVPAGKTVALVGPSGAGKSTILNLIPRFYDAEHGAVLIDGTDVRDVTLASLRAKIALVSQEISLFDDSVRANIAYGRWGASDEEIIAAARHAAAHDFITALPQGYDTMVGEQGVKLSGGQRQRLAIARAMLKNAPILLLDEATSALDTESERQVQAALKTLMAGRTTLVIAHRLSTVADADLIYVIDQGRVAEKGTHGELLARGGAYAHLYNLQFVDEGEVIRA